MPRLWLNSDQSKTASMWKVASLKRAPAAKVVGLSPRRSPSVAGGIAEQTPGREKRTRQSLACSSNTKPLKLTSAACIQSNVRRVRTHGLGGNETVVVAVPIGDETARCLQGAARFEHSLGPGVPNRSGRLMRLFLGFAFRERGGCVRSRIAAKAQSSHRVSCARPANITCLKISACIMVKPAVRRERKEAFHVDKWPGRSKL